jgi:16S rRNA (adenine1518-N6/adenine1519-N6)-dimethyltransferase
MTDSKIRPIKSLGQNFLKDRAVAERILSKSGIQKNDAIFEIGPGTGALTDLLVSRTGFVAAVEIDRQLIARLKKQYIDRKNVAILHADVLDLDFTHGIDAALAGKAGEDYPGKPDGTGPFKIIANLPYYITTPIVMKLLEELPEPAQMTFMVQKEVAQRMAADPGGKDYGVLSVAVQYYCKPEILFIVPPYSFDPKPEVDSAVIRLRPYTEPPVQTTDKAMFFKTVRAAFGQRRKTLQNALSNSGITGLGKEEILEMLRRLGIPDMARGETLSMEQFATLSNEICKMKNN